MENEIDDEVEGSLEDAGMSEDDYGFIVDSEGNLKAIYLPDNPPPKHPKNVQKILKLFGLDDVDQVDNPTIH